ncbi:MAG: DUF6883 domain-containing protein [Spirochaetota bacterium]
MRLADEYIPVVEERKVKEYLLNPDHPDGAPKARFFRALGYGAGDWRSLAENLKQHARENDAAYPVESPFGKKYIVVGPLRSSGNNLTESPVVSVWIAERGSLEARLVTAYPVR